MIMVSSRFVVRATVSYWSGRRKRKKIPLSRSSSSVVGARHLLFVVGCPAPFHFVLSLTSATKIPRMHARVV